MKSLRIWIADDSAVDRERLTKILAARSATLKTFHSAQELLRELEKQPPEIMPDLFVLDIVMPGMSGFEACRRLRASEYFSEVPVLLCSVKNLSTDRMWAKEQGASGYLTKPITSEHVWDKIDAVLSRPSTSAVK
jgi:CheY-like chemotaxis protein